MQQSLFILYFATVTLQCVWPLPGVTFHFIWLLPQLLFILYGFCHSYSSFYMGFARGYFLFYMAFARVTHHCIWLLPQLLFILDGFCHSHSLFDMVFVKRLLIIKLPPPLLVQPLSHSSFAMAFATVTLHFIWFLQQLLFNLYGLCQGLLFILYGSCHNYSSSFYPRQAPVKEGSGVQNAWASLSKMFKKARHKSSVLF